MTQKDIARECSVNKINKKKETGSVEVSVKGELLNPRKTSYDLQEDLEKIGVKIHDSTIRRRLLDGGRKAVRP